ncbi:MAG: hypothetical protein ACXW5U_32440 [Thermoanaerobaculia bacterium]
MPEPRRIGDIVAQTLSVHLGPNVARMAVKAFAQKAVARKPEELTSAELPALVEAMRPMLVVMIGKNPSEAVLGEIERACQF